VVNDIESLTEFYSWKEQEEEFNSVSDLESKECLNQDKCPKRIKKMSHLYPYLSQDKVVKIS